MPGIRYAFRMPTIQSLLRESASGEEASLWDVQADLGDVIYDAEFQRDSRAAIKYLYAAEKAETDKKFLDNMMNAINASIRGSLKLKYERLLKKYKKN